MGSCGVGFVCDIKGKKSHDIVRWGLEAVKNLTHRGAIGADGKTGDGAGVLVQIPARFFVKEMAKAGHQISSEEDLAVGVFFLYQDLTSEIEQILRRYSLKIICWREVPVDDDALGASALSSKPVIRQLLLDAGAVAKQRRETALYLARRSIEKTYAKRVYVPSLSSRTIVYKGMLVAQQLDRFYPDLASEDFESALCLFHQRFSTNTFPDWTMAQPLRVLAHNGEINTLKGNRNWMTAMEEEIGHEVFGDDGDLLRPLISPEESDSASLDRIIELLIRCGFSPEHALNLCVPPAREGSGFTKDERNFLDYQSLLMRPWDGPAAITFTDGTCVGAHLDRNGLRPLRYSLTEDGIILLGSEAGMTELGGRKITEKGRLGPGETISADMREKKLRYSNEIMRDLAKRRLYGKWLDQSLVGIEEGDAGAREEGEDVIRKQAAFGYSSEEVRTSLKGMAETGKEFIFSMGDDTPLPPLSEKPQLLYRYFKQRFSQVTNPPIDPIRERMVMSLRMNLGYKMNFLRESPGHGRRLRIGSPVLLYDHVRKIEGQKIIRVERVPITYAKSVTTDGGDLITCCAPGQASVLSGAVAGLQRRVLERVRKGAEIIILSDRDISGERVAIPALLAVSACFQYLREKGLVNRVSFVIETGEARDIHHIACLIGFGASAVYPYLACQTLGEMCETGEIKTSYSEAAANYKKAVEEGLLKVIARMGISTINSYHGAALFDAVCLNRDFVEEFFGAADVTLESDGLPEIEDSVMKRHDFAYKTSEPVLESGGDLRHRKEGQWHAWSTSSVIALNRFVKNPDYPLYKDFSKTADNHPVYIRHLLTYKEGDQIPVETVEPEEHILRRFFSGAMSVGALSPEAHETIAEACNRLGIKSNSGEGGEDPQRYSSPKNSAIKQIASGRFGVTPGYLASAVDLEIKIAQGAKPGEGGHLPGNKVSDYIAALRHCVPNTLLISPPPHHDIYSIEDLAQLINDLKQANPKALVCVKLVSEAGVGTVAAGAAKAFADIVQISGCEGGTGASPVSSIKNAGNYWETGLAETQRVLIENGLRDRVSLRVDGGLRTAKDVIIAALLGAEEFGFGTATMIATGCVMARQCHLNTCPTGIATQDERLRAKFKGTVEQIISYFRALAREVREILAGMGFRSFDDMIGRADLLTGDGEKGPIVEKMKLDDLFRGYAESKPRRRMTLRNDNPAPSMNDMLVRELLPFIEKGETVEREYGIRNVDRSVPLRLDYHIAMRYGDEGLPRDTLRLTFKGTAGQSFGAFNHKGLSLTLIGDANDYVGKSMFGGRMVIKSPDVLASHDHVIMGNTVLYGAIGGELYAAGKAGERFAVRNSGATAVVEGTGLHLCEYMTRGTVVVLGEVGFNVGAGMTGGVIYLFDEEDSVKRKINESYVKAVPLEHNGDIATLKSLLEKHYNYTTSPRARGILDDFDGALNYFIKVVPL